MTCIIVVNRDIQLVGCTLGEMLLDGNHFCWTLEDENREVLGDDGQYHWVPERKVPGQTAIPSGLYRVILSMSPRFKRVLPEILGVPNYSYVRFHGANDPRDVEGCIGIGANRDVSNSRISNCAAVVNELVDYLKEKLDAHETVWLDVGYGPGPRHRPV